jgi:hypothetical protein
MITLTRSLGLVLGCIAVANAADALRFFPDMDAFKAQWYARQLQALQEPVLCCESLSGGRVVRFLWLRSFQHPVVIRLNEMTAGSWRLMTKTGSGAGGGDPGTVATANERTLTAADAAALPALFKPTSWFWNTASAQAITTGKCAPDKTCVTLTGDGSQWIIEVRDGNRYHYVDRWSPKDGPVHEMGERLIALSQQNFGTIQ